MSEAVATPATEAEVTRTEEVVDAGSESQVVESPVITSGEDYLKSLEPKEADTPAPEIRRPSGPDPEIVSRARARFNQLHSERQSKLDSYKQEYLEVGVPETLVNRWIKDNKDILNSHHADSLNLAGYESMMQAQTREQEAVWDGIRSNLQPAQFKDFESALLDAAKGDPSGVVPYKTVLNLHADAKYAKWVSPADHRTEVAKAFDAGRSQAERTASSAKSADNGVRGSSSASSEPKDWKDVENRVMAGTLSTSEARAYAQRFGHKLPR